MGPHVTYKRYQIPYFSNLYTDWPIERDKLRQFYRGNPAVFVNLKQIAIVPSNTATFCVQLWQYVSVWKDYQQANII